MKYIVPFPIDKTRLNQLDQIATKLGLSHQEFVNRIIDEFIEGNRVLLAPKPEQSGPRERIVRVVLKCR